MNIFLLLLRLASALLKAMCSYNKTHLLTSLADRSGQVSITIHINLIRQGFGESSLKEGMLRSINAFFSLPSFYFLCLEYKCDFEGEARILQPWSNETWGWKLHSGWSCKTWEGSVLDIKKACFSLELSNFWLLCFWAL